MLKSFKWDGLGWIGLGWVGLDWVGTMQSICFLKAMIKTGDDDDGGDRDVNRGGFGSHLKPGLVSV